jgi:regulator of sirC expression with transglutaminase-like and TPR domain
VNGDLDRAIALDPEYTRACALRGLAYAEIGEREEAITDLKSALALDLSPDQKRYVEAQLKELEGE